MAPGRRFLQKGRCTAVSKSFKSKTIKWYLFSDILVITNARNQLKKYIPASSAILSYVILEGKKMVFIHFFG